MSVVCAKIKSYHGFVAARVIAGFAGASCEGLTVAISADLFFVHERGWWMGLYVISLCAGPSLGSIWSGFIIENLGWRWHFWVGSISLRNG
jgi:MFS family permease